MSTPAPETTSAPAQEPTDTTPSGQGNPTEPQPTPAPAQEPDWKAEARKWEARAKENIEAARRLAEIEEANKSEAQKAAERLQALEAKVKEYETREQIATWTDEVVDAAEGLDEAQKARLRAALRGTTKEEIEAHAATLLPLIGSTAEPAPAGPQPVPAVGKTPPVPGNVPLKDQIAAAEAAGDKDLVRTLKAMQVSEAFSTS